MSPTNPANRYEPPLDFEPIADLIERLGPPPQGIVDRWCEQLRAAAIADASTLIPEIDLSKWMIGPSGELACGSQTYSYQPEVNPDAPISEVNQNRMEAFRSAVLQPETNQPNVTATDTTARSVNHAHPQASTTRTKKRRLTKANWSAVAALLVVLVILAALWATRPLVEPVAEISVVTANPRQNSLPPGPTSSDQAKIALNSGQAVDDFPAARESSEPDEMTLKTFASGSSESSEADELPDVRPSLLEVPFSTDLFLPAEDNYVHDPNMATGDDSQQNAPQAPPQEIPQPVRLAKVQAITLPKLNGDVASVRIDGLSNDNLILEFPYPIALQLQQQKPSNTYLIRETKDGRIIASLRGDEPNSLLFAWDEEGWTSASAGLLQHGRLKDAKGLVTYLRPSIEADRWAISFSESDYQPSWDLAGVIPPLVSRLSVAFDLPEEVEVGWVEPVDSDQPRRSKAAAVLSHKEFEFVQIAVWLNMRCSRKFVCEVRFAARLDPSLAWQSFTETGLAAYSSRLLQQSDQLDQQQTRLDALYAQADSRVRKSLQDNRANLKTQIEWTTEMSARVSQLQAMVTSLGINGAIRFEILSRWHDGDQVLLSMPP